MTSSASAAAAAAAKLGHLERTATEPRDKSLHTVVLRSIDQVNDQTRIFRLGIPENSPPLRFLPGQWLDVYVPGVEKAGGFTITSTPREARLPHPSGKDDVIDKDNKKEDDNDHDDGTKEDTREGKSMGQGQGQGGPYLELAVQKSPDNPPAAWLWQDPPSALLGQELRVRVGGSFVWPPPGINVRALRKVVFVAGGVGVNPLVSMLSAIATTSSAQVQAKSQPEIHFFYSLKDPLASGSKKGEGGRRTSKEMLFLDRIAEVFREERVKGKLHVFLTSGPGGNSKEAGGQRLEQDQDQEKDNVITTGQGSVREGSIPFHPRRCTVCDDVADVLDTPAERRLAVVYVCGVPTMTDSFVAELTDRRTGLGMEPHRVLYEKWW